jgi:hypothetical protein
VHVHTALFVQQLLSDQLALGLLLCRLLSGLHLGFRRGRRRRGDSDHHSGGGGGSGFGGGFGLGLLLLCLLFAVFVRLRVGLRHFAFAAGFGLGFGRFGFGGGFGFGLALALGLQRLRFGLGLFFCLLLRNESGLLLRLGFGACGLLFRLPVFGVALVFAVRRVRIGVVARGGRQRRVVCERQERGVVQRTLMPLPTRGVLCSTTTTTTTHPDRRMKAETHDNRVRHTNNQHVRRAHVCSTGG